MAEISAVLGLICYYHLFFICAMVRFHPTTEVRGLSRSHARNVVMSFLLSITSPDEHMLISICRTCLVSSGGVLR